MLSHCYQDRRENGSKGQGTLWAQWPTQSPPSPSACLMSPSQAPHSPQVSSEPTVEALLQVSPDQELALVDKPAQAFPLLGQDGENESRGYENTFPLRAKSPHLMRRQWEPHTTLCMQGSQREPIMLPQSFVPSQGPGLLWPWLPRNPHIWLADRGQGPGARGQSSVSPNQC